MKVLFVGGTGNISAACARLCLERGMEVFLLNRGQTPNEVPGAKLLLADARDADQVARAIEGRTFDAVADFIGFVPADVERAFELFQGKTGQYLYVSSCAAYAKPLPVPITESTPLANPWWDYARNKIACEERLTTLWRERGFPVVILRPSLTYATLWPVAVAGSHGFTLIDRIRRGGELVVHGDGTSLWTVTHSEDFALGFAGLVGNTAALGHAFHITSDEVLSWDQIYTTIAQAAGAAPRLVHIPSEVLTDLDQRLRGTLLGDKAHSAVFDNSKIKRFVPGFASSIPFHLGVRRTLAWFEADATRQRTTPEVNQALDRYLAAWRKMRPRDGSSDGPG
jgi:nucleoside-diphosphate-sugar epimerase